MSNSTLLIASLTILFSVVGAAPTEVKSQATIDSEVFALTRDGLSRTDPDGLFYGFFAAWPVVMLILSATCFVLAIVFFLGHLTGVCRGKETVYRQVAQI